MGFGDLQLELTHKGVTQFHRDLKKSLGQFELEEDKYKLIVRDSKGHRKTLEFTAPPGQTKAQLEIIAQDTAKKNNCTVVTWYEAEMECLKRLGEDLFRDDAKAQVQFFKEKMRKSGFTSLEDLPMSVLRSWSEEWRRNHPRKDLEENNMNGLKKLRDLLEDDNDPVKRFKAWLDKEGAHYMSVRKNKAGYSASLLYKFKGGNIVQWSGQRKVQIINTDTGRDKIVSEFQAEI